MQASISKYFAAAKPKPAKTEGVGSTSPHSEHRNKGRSNSHLSTSLASPPSSSNGNPEDTIAQVTFDMESNLARSNHFSSVVNMIFDKPEIPTTTSSTSTSSSSSSSGPLTPLERQVVELKAQYKGCLLMVECGYRFRFFGEDANLASKVYLIHHLYVHLSLRFYFQTSTHTHFAGTQYMVSL